MRDDLDTVAFDRAYYLKLGEGGAWEASSLTNGIARIGWRRVPLRMILERDWAAVEELIRAEARTKGKGTTDLNALRTFCDSTPADVWITFSGSRLWWCRLADGPLREDDLSKYRELRSPWSDRDANGRRLLINEIPGQVSSVQGYRGTLCRIRNAPVLERLLSGRSSEAYLQSLSARERLEEQLVQAIKQLHWKDFETLVDSIFRQAGWKRLSVLGETMKFVDLELEEPITGDRYQVQVKSRASLSEFTETASGFSDQGFRRLYYVVHTPEKALEHAERLDWPHIELLLPERLASMVVDGGLVRWLMDRIR